MVKEVTKGVGFGAKLELLKHLDDLINVARSRASAKGLLEEFESTVNKFTGNMNIIRPMLLVGLASRLDITFEEFERILTSSNKVMDTINKPYWDVMRELGVFKPTGMN